MDKNAIKKFATWARRELIDRVRQQAYRYEVEGADADWNASTARGVVLTPVQRTQRQALGADAGSAHPATGVDRADAGQRL